MVAESLVDHQHGDHVVHDEPDLIGAAAGLREAFIRAGHRGRQTHHHSVVDNRAILHKERWATQGKERDNTLVRTEDNDSALPIRIAKKSDIKYETI